MLRDRNVGVFFTDRGPVLAAHSRRRGIALQTEFVGGRAVEPAAGGRSQTVVNYYVGDSLHWSSGAPSYGELTYSGVWPGVDVSYQPRPRGFEYTVIVHPGGKPDSVRLACRGAQGVEISSSGSLRIHTDLGTIEEHMSDEDEED